MKSLLELEKEIPATVAAAGLHAYWQARGASTESRCRAIYAAMQYEQQLLIAGQQAEIRKLKDKRRFITSCMAVD